MSTFTDGFLQAFKLILSADPEIVDITLFSFQLSFGAIILALIIGIPAGLVIGHYNFIGKNILTTLVNTLTGFPPVVMGVFLYVLLSRTGPLGFLQLLYSPVAMLLAQFLLALPIIISTTIQAVAGLPKEFFETLSSLGLKGKNRNQVIIREIRSSLIIGGVIGFGRAISEVGAILIVGGNIRWHTRTLTTASVLEISRGSPELAIALGIILLTVSFLVNLILHLFQYSIIRPTWLKFGSQEKIKHSKSDIPFENNEYLIKKYFPKLAPISINCLDITKKYDEQIVLNKISIRFIPGKIYTIIGPNGVGKSTLLRLISGIDKQFTGKIDFEPESKYKPYLHQMPYMLKGNVMQNLNLITKDKDVIDGVIHDFGLEELINKNVVNLSGGEKRRTAIARLFLTNPNYLILDEPTADLDPAGVGRIEKILEYLRDKGLLIIMTTHNLLQAKRIADNIVIHLGETKIITGNVKEIFESDDPEIKAFIDGTLPW